ncbi:MAG: ATP-binding protein [Proteobacteria bacterium]|nr:ATP-binding protein [Pseudomonadota bacterium]
MAKLGSLFAQDLQAVEIIKKLTLYFNIPIEPEITLIIFDEVQECPAALNCLKYFYEDAPQYHIIAAGSLLGIKLAHTHGFPVGKVTFQHLYPLSFMEFLHAIGKNQWADLLNSIHPTDSIAELFHQELTELLKTYFYVGGMPEAVYQYSQTQDWRQVQQVQADILRAYELDFAKHAPKIELGRISSVWQAVPSQLAKENKKFVYSVLKKSARGREYENAIHWLIDADLILNCKQVSIPQLPLQHYLDHQAFKTYLLDVGLLSNMNQVDPRILLEQEQLFKEFSGALTENYVAQTLTAGFRKPLHYWKSEGKAEIDFLIEANNKTLPLEVKAGISLQKKSLLVFLEKFQPALLLRTSLLNLCKNNQVLNVPLYALEQLPRFLNQL